MNLRRRLGSVPHGTPLRDSAPERVAFLSRADLPRADLPRADLRRVLAGASALAPVAALWPLPALAEGGAQASLPSAVMGFSLFATGVAGCALAALVHLMRRRGAGAKARAALAELAAARAALDRANAFLAIDRQVMIAFGAADEAPEIIGDPSLVVEPGSAASPLAFGAWLAPEPAAQIEACVERLRARGESFRLSLATRAGLLVEVDGRAVGGRAVLRIRDLGGDRLELAQARERGARACVEADSLRALLDAAPGAAWMRDSAGKLTWVNAAYARAVEAADAREAVARGLELLESGAREASAQARGRGETWRQRAPAVVAGQRRMLDIVEAPTPAGAVAFTLDQSELESVRADLGRQMDSHARTLDQLSTAVAIFDRAKRLVFHNSAYRQLWSLDAGWLEGAPTDSEILDRLRAERRLPEQVDFRAWKDSVHAAYQSAETNEQVWYLPDRRTLRVVSTPNSQGGVTYLFDDVTDSYALQTQYRALVTVQGETLDSLREGVAVFGADGRLKLVNVAFAALWGFDAAQLKGALEAAETERARAPHVDDVRAQCSPQCPQDDVWTHLRGVVAGLHDARTGFQRKVRRADGSVLDCAAAPLPDGSTLVTFSDVTAAANEERALTERNEALIAAQKLREDFVHHVSYELRSPLTNIIGFIHLLGDEAVGALNPKQREYAGHILDSSAALLAIINDILDLATIDSDALELDLGDVDVATTMRDAAKGVQDRLAEASITLNIVPLDGVGSFRADAKRVRQVLFNLLSNAIGFSQPGQTVTLAALRREDALVFKVTDQGRGIPADVIESVFDRFRTHSAGSRHRGVGLGLSIVRSLVELHGGAVHIQSAPGEGTVVTCTFPVAAQARKLAQAR